MTHRVAWHRFYDTIRHDLFGGRLTQEHVRGLRALLGAAFDFEPEEQAYILGTVYHETDRRMWPIEEYGKGRNRSYGAVDAGTGKAYYGRGFVQLTWKINYEKASQEVGLDLVNNPDLVLQPDVSAYICCVGMRDGWFTGKALKDFWVGHDYDYVNARRIVNGLDRAQLIAGYAQKFEAALNNAYI